MVPDFAARLKFFRSKRDLSQVELSKLVGISGKQISDYEVGTSKPRQTTYLKLLNALQISDTEFQTTDIANYGGLPLNLMVPILDWVNVSKISNSIPDDLRDKAVRHIFVDSSQVSESYARNMNHIFALDIKGESMIPFLFSEDIIVIDISRKNIIDGKTYLVSALSHEAIIRRCYKTPNGTIRLSTYNASFPEYEFSLKDLSIIGELIWRGGGLNI
ncbi:LexA family transcriptional regulator [Acinetobacter schindleri]|jgi:transcriptional regulator with XRE-family HTH domain|uniref:LexA family transcriptional regulator n=1 Tax=Acinetobacter schindleri TaxID=108981 RepID=UPI0028986F7F|nr:S24 family peptidase [Acinetobacter schindleri]